MSKRAHSADTSPPEAAHPALTGNRRIHERLDYHTAVTVIVDSEDGFHCIRSRSSDLSVNGARIVCHEPLQTPIVFLRILVPQLSEQFVEAEVANERCEKSARLGHPKDVQYVYGLQFRRLVSDQGILDRLRIVAATRTPVAAQLARD